MWLLPSGEYSPLLSLSNCCSVLSISAVLRQGHCVARYSYHHHPKTGRIGGKTKKSGSFPFPNLGWSVVKRKELLFPPPSTLSLVALATVLFSVWRRAFFCLCMGGWRHAGPKGALVMSLTREGYKLITTKSVDFCAFFQLRL